MTVAVPAAGLGGTARREYDARVRKPPAGGPSPAGSPTATTNLPGARVISLNLNIEFEARVASHLADDQVVWLTTVDAAGTPQPTPVWFLWDGQSVLVYSKPGQAKLRNVAANPRVSLSFNSDVHGNDVVVLLGSAAVDPGAPPADASPAYVAKYGPGIASIDLTPASFSAEYAVAVRVVPDRLRGF